MRFVDDRLVLGVEPNFEEQEDLAARDAHAGLVWEREECQAAEHEPLEDVDYLDPEELGAVLRRHRRERTVAEGQLARRCGFAHAIRAELCHCCKRDTEHVDDEHQRHVLFIELVLVGLARDGVVFGEDPPRPARRNLKGAGLSEVIEDDDAQRDVT